MPLRLESGALGPPPLSWDVDGLDMSTQSSAAEVEMFLASLPRRQTQIVGALRRLIRQTAPETTETVLWASLSYHRTDFGGRIKGAVCLITPRPDCVQLGFIHGSAIADPFHLLRGSSKAKRFVPIVHVRDIDRQALSGLVRAAAEHDPRRDRLTSGCTEPPPRAAVS